MATIYEQIGQKIRELRLAYPKGALSQETLAAKIGAVGNTVSRWETGTYKPTAEDLDKLARFFNVPITVFFPDQQGDTARIEMLTSATGGLDPQDFEEVIKYAEFRKARSALEGAKRARPKR
jgi:transcriptional regulator with XRE-family HTH domain